MKYDKINYASKKAKDFNIWTRIYQYYAMYCLFLPIFGGLFYKFITKRDKDFDQKKRYIIAPNHISYIDVFALNYAVGQPLAYMAKQELFKFATSLQKYVTNRIWKLGAFAVNREKPALSTIKTVKEVFKANYSLCIFPQGGIRKNKVIENINGGFVYFAKTNKIDIVPVGLSGMESYNWKPFRKKTVNLTVGKPISYELDMEEIMIQWAKQVGELSGYGYAPEDKIMVHKKGE